MTQVLDGSISRLCSILGTCEYFHAYILCPSIEALVDCWRFVPFPMKIKGVKFDIIVVDHFRKY